MVNHGAGLLRLTDDQQLVDALRTEWRTAALAEADAGMLAYAEKLTMRPWEMVEDDVVSLRELGFSDSAILDINQVTSYYAFVNRIADGLGVELEATSQT